MSAFAWLKANMTCPASKPLSRAKPASSSSEPDTKPYLRRRARSVSHLTLTSFLVAASADFHSSLDTMSLQLGIFLRVVSCISVLT